MKLIPSIVCAFCTVFSLVAGPTLTESKPEEAGYSPERLEVMHQWLESKIDEGLHAGAVSLIVKDGKIIDWQTYGYRDLENKDAVKKDDIFRIFSMSKVMTSVAALTLFEQGKFQLTDPVSKYIPEIAKMRVYVSGGGDALVLEDQKTAMTIKQLFTHTTGIPYDFSVEGPLFEIYKNYEEFREETGEGFIRELVKKPLVHQPGARPTYGMSTDVLGRLVEVISGQTLGAYMKEHLLGPLGLEDTFFEVPEDKKNRLVALYTYEEGKLRKMDTEKDSVIPVDGSRLVGIESGGGGLYSTAKDYAIFAQMLLNGGEYDGVRILSPKTVELMTSNHLEGMGDETHMFNDYEGFGLGVSVRISLSKGNALGSIGQYGWTGAATTFYNADPEENLFAILLIQHMPYDQHGLFPYFQNLYYQAMEE